MAEDDYLADLIKKVKKAKQEEIEAADVPKKAEHGANVPKEIENIKKRTAPVSETASTAKVEPSAIAETKSLQGKIPELPPEEEIVKEDDENKKSTVEKELETATGKKLLEKYADVKIYSVPGKPLPYYVVPVARPTKQEKAVINTIKEAATRLIAITPYKVRDVEQRRNLYRQRVLEILRNSPELHIPERRFAFYAESVIREMVGYGIIDPLIVDDNLEEIMVIGAKKPVYLFHRKYDMMSSNIEFYSNKEIIDLINRIARHVGRRVDISSPLLDARMPDGSRVNATIPPASVEGATLTIRKFRKDPYTIVDLIKNGTISAEVAAFFWLCVDGLGAKPANMLIAGGTGSGKTTTLNCLASFIPDTERVVSIEDTAELALPLKHWVRLEARPPGLEGKGEITLEVLTKNSLRMRPDRIIVGEVRHDEAFTLFTALNTGHDGALHGNTLIQLANGNIAEISKIVEKEFEEKSPIKEGVFEFVETGKKIMVPSLNKQTLKIENKKITHVWKKRTKEKLCKIRLKSGKELFLTKDHPIYKINNGLQEINACDAKINDFIAVPTGIEIEAKKTLMQPYLAGLIYRDGHLGAEAIQFVNKEETLIQTFGKTMSSLTKNKVSRFDYENFSGVQVYDKKLIKKINEEYEMPIGNKTKIFKMTEKTLTTKDSEIALLVQGLFDCEAHVNLLANCIQFSTANKDLARKMPLILMRFNIDSSTYGQEKDGKGNIGPYYRISIYGKNNLEKFEEKIGFAHKKKKERLSALVKKSKNSLDLFPNMQRQIKNARLEAGFTQGELGALLGATTGSNIRSYETSIRNPSRKQLNKICNILQNESTKPLEMLVKSSTRFEKIVSVEEKSFDGYVYDLTVEGNHNYIANGVIVSNCMGTIHANSPQETIIRVISPPMNVPEVMLSGLDIIIIEHKIHDRRKGTIRRVTEIAEVSGVLLKHAQTQTIFMRDPVTDKLERTNIPIKFLKVLQNFTGLSNKAINDNWKQRQVFLEKLCKQGIKGMDDFKEKTRNFSYRGN